jgi:uncharacterized protein
MTFPPESSPGPPLEPLEPLDPRATTLFRITGLVRGGFLVGGVFLAEWLIETAVPFLLPTTLAAVLVLISTGAIPPLRYRTWGFALRDSDLLLHYGVLFRTVSIVPHARIQHVDTQRGPLERWLGLTELVVYTAGVRGAILSIPGLSAERADELRDRLVALSGAGDAV